MKTSQWKILLVVFFSVVSLMSTTAAYSQVCSFQSDSINVVPDQNFVIPIRINDAPNQVVSLGLYLAFDPSVLVYTGYTRGDLTVNFDFFEVNLATFKTIVIGGFELGEDVIAAGSSGVVVNLNFTALEPRLPGCFW
jgi:hypothetical protein